VKIAMATDHPSEVPVSNKAAATAIRADLAIVTLQSA
jgi:hypothetical protein